VFGGRFRRIACGWGHLGECVCIVSRVCVDFWVSHSVRPRFSGHKGQFLPEERVGTS